VRTAGGAHIDGTIDIFQPQAECIEETAGLRQLGHFQRKMVYGMDAIAGAAGQIKGHD
jgi:hypothetical protein